MLRTAPRCPARLAGLALALILGCDSEAPGPVPPPSRPLDPVIAADTSAPAGKSAGGTTAPAGMRELVLVLPRKEDPNYDFWEAAARQDASIARAYLSASRPSPKDPPARQADLVREAAGRSPTAILIIPEDPKAVAPALAEARDRGIIVLVLDAEVPVEGKPLRRITFAPIDRAAAEMVAFAIETAKAAGFTTDDPALILDSADGDEASQRRVALLKSLIEEQGIKPLPVQKTGGYFGDPMPLIEGILEKHPRLAMVFADKDTNLSSATMYRHDLPTDRPRYVLAGFAMDKRTLEMVGRDQVSGAVDMNVGALAHRAVEVALGLADGRDFPDHIEIPRDFVRATGPPKDVRTRSFGSTKGRGFSRAKPAQ